VGSNSWVIPKKTKNGKVILQMPAYWIFATGEWYEAHIVTPEFNYMVIWQEHLSPCWDTIGITLMV
jgi:hypothetical protein